MSLNFDTLRKANSIRGGQWDKNPATLDDLSFRAMELGGEAGEALNVAKKIVRQLKGRPGGLTLEAGRLPLAEELADVVICADRVAELIGVDLSGAVIDKFNKTSRKHGFIEITPSKKEMDYRALQAENAELHRRNQALHKGIAGAIQSLESSVCDLS